MHEHQTTNNNNRRRKKKKNMRKINSRYVRIVRRKWKQRLNIKQFIARMWNVDTLTMHSSLLFISRFRCTNSFSQNVVFSNFFFVHLFFPNPSFIIHFRNLIFRPSATAAILPNKFGQIAANNFLSRTFLRIAQENFFFYIHLWIVILSRKSKGDQKMNVEQFVNKGKFYVVTFFRTTEL